MAGWIGYHRRTEVGDFTCRRCGWHGRGAVTVVGVGRATLFFDKPEKALVDARQDASERGRTALQRAYCKKCEKRNPGEEVAFWLPWALVAALVLALLVREIVLLYEIQQLTAASGGSSHNPFFSFETIAVALLVGGVAWVGWKKWQNRDGGVEWLDG